MSSLTGWKRTDGQRLSPLLGAICGPSTLTLELAARHPRRLRGTVDAVFPLVGWPARHDATWRELTVDGGAGPLRARLYEPAATDGGLLVFLHGGGFAVGGLRSHVNLCRFAARLGRVKVLAVEYRKAPEARLPAAFDDASAAFAWAVAHADELRVDPTRIGMGGDSAGGQLAAAVAAHADERARPAFTWLLYPVVDADLCAYESAWLFERGPLLSQRNALGLLHQYAPDLAAKTDPRLTLWGAPDLARLPPTYLVTAGMDPLRDQGRRFAELLGTAGVAVEYDHVPDAPHGFALLLVDRHCREATARAADALRRLAAPVNASAPQATLSSAVTPS